MSWLGIDIGTSAVKVVVCKNGRTIAETNVSLSVSRPEPLWSEQNPADWWDAVQSAIRKLEPAVRSNIQAIGLTGQMHGAVLLDDADEVLRPAILWNDGRSHAQCAELDGLARQITGNIAMPGFTAPKLLWLRQYEPEVFEKTRYVLLPKDYIRLMLTGEKVSDMSDAAGSLWLDTQGRKWSDEMLQATGLTMRNMPRLVEGNEISGHVLPAIAAALDLPTVPVAGGGGDQAAGAIGAGVTEPGEAFLSLGTSGVIFAVSDGFAANPANAVHAFCHALPERWHVMSVMLSAAASLHWVANLTGFQDVESALAAAEEREMCAENPVFLPYLSGERTPHNDVSATGAFFGLTHEHQPADLVNAVLEGVAFGLRDGLDALNIPVTELSVMGGGARSDYWMQHLSDILQVPLVVRDGADAGPASGAARLAKMAVTEEMGSAACRPPKILSRFSPGQPQTVRLTRFRNLYAAVRPLYSQGLSHE